MTSDMTYREYKQKLTKKAVFETAAVLAGASPAVAGLASSMAANPAVSIPLTAAAGTATGVGLYKKLVGDDLEGAHQNMLNSINDTSKAYREYLKWRQQRDATKNVPVVPAKPNLKPAFPDKPAAVPAAKQKRV